MKTIFMTKAQWEKWDKALRSGKYKQGKDYLYNEATEGYCCLGVLQKELSGEVERHAGGASRSLPSVNWLNDNGIQFIPCIIDDEVACAEDAYLPELGSRAAVANDMGVSFVDIADAIKQAVQFTDRSSHDV